MNPALQSKLTTAQAVAELIQNNEVIGFSGFTIFGNPKLIPPALAERGKALHAAGQDFGISVYTGASVDDQMDGELARSGVMKMRMPYQSNKDVRSSINRGDTLYVDQHLSHMSKLIRQGFVPRPTTAIIEAVDVEVHGDKAHVYLSGSAGSSATYLYSADRVFIELNSYWGDAMKGVHDVYTCGMQPSVEPIQIMNAGTRLGKDYVEIPLAKIHGILETNLPDKKGPFDAPDAQSIAIADYILEFLAHERKMGRLPEGLPYQSGVGNVANAVLASMATDPKQAPFSMYTEVLQDSIFQVLENDKLQVASATAFSLSMEGQNTFKKNAAAWKKHFILRQQEISNNPEVVRRLGTISMNTAIEVDIFGNANSTHIMGTQMMNGIGGSGDFSRNAYLPIFMTTSTAKGGAISCIVPMVSHVDHHEHDTQIFVSEQGLADLRGLAPVPRAREIIKKCAHPDYAPLLTEYLEYGLKNAKGKHTPHTLSRAFEFHNRFLETGTMKV
ncbi:MAG TPA: acetyl-CoA hydrolase/transferase C-terminal domain-containing protein [Fibrobacteraceae bacterium]|nr:acetyl-CoA hydrolase/transferase C-terminal domain-containing protein [Fibrobacteraceae bacterium]